MKREVDTFSRKGKMLITYLRHHPMPHPHHTWFSEITPCWTRMNCLYLVEPNTEIQGLTQKHSFFSKRKWAQPERYRHSQRSHEWPVWACYHQLPFFKLQLLNHSYTINHPFSNTPMEFQCYLASANNAALSISNAGGAPLIPGLERYLGEENGNPLQYSCLGNPIGRGAWWATAHRGAKESGMT